jgi:limonene 1,2-monooxygenase
MKFKKDNLKFGMFIGPFHKPGINPTLMLQQDLQIIEQLDMLGFDEVWIGEHHSGGIESIGSPEIVIAAAAERTKRIKLGTGALSAPWHNPFMVAERFVLLDHLTRGRTMLGVGPGQLLQDATMIGSDVLKQRERLDEALGIILRLFRGETVTHKSDWFELVDAKLQMLPYSDFDCAVVSVASPSGPIVAGKHGVNMISVAATSPQGFEVLADQWAKLEEVSALNGNVADRSGWRLLGPMHLARTFEEAKEQVRFGLSQIEDYRGRIHPQAQGPDYWDLDGIIKLMNDTGACIIGTPEMARKQIQRLIDKTGGFGTYMLMGADWANFQDTLSSNELFASEVMPYFNGGVAPMLEAYDRVMDTGFEAAEATRLAQDQTTARFEKERAARS